jgi:hypothetical protein
MDSSLVAGVVDVDEEPEPDYVEVVIAAIARHEAQRSTGRPTALTPRKLRKLFDALERGNFREPACARAGIAYRTFRNWMEAGSQDEDQETPQGLFAAAVEHAEAVWEDKALTRVNDAAENPRNWMAGVIMLSRRHRERWAERKPDEGRHGGVTVIVAVPGNPNNPRPVLDVSPGVLGPGSPQNQPLATVRLLSSPHDRE